MSDSPRYGEIMYSGSGGKYPVRIVHVEGTLFAYVPINVEVRHTHKGNLYNAVGETPYWE